MADGRLLLACHGRLYEGERAGEWPHYVDRAAMTAWLKKTDRKAFMIDRNPFVDPDATADLTRRAVTVAAVRTASVGLLLPMHCDYTVYGTWSHPNAPFFAEAARMRAACSSWRCRTTAC
jgi:hypothetical protein